MLHRSPLALLCRLTCLLLLAAAIAANAQDFAQPMVVPTGNWPTAVYTADVNGDGYPDLIYIDQGATPNQPSTTHVLLDVHVGGAPSFVPSATLPTVGDSIAVGPITGSGHVDIGWITATPADPNTGYSTYTLNVLPGNGDGTFGALVTRSVQIGGIGATPVWVYTIAGQINNTGPMYVLAENANNETLWVFSFNLTLLHGKLTTALNGSVTNGPGPITVADLNGDGYGDVIIQGAQTYLAAAFLYSPANQALTPNPLPIAGEIHSLLIRDVNRDGRQDLIAEGANGRIDVFAGNGDGTFQTTSSGGTGTLDGRTGNGGHLIALYDTNNDGQLDAITATPAGVSELLGQGTGYLGLGGIYNAGPGMHSFATADLFHGGNLDVITDSPEGIAILLGNSNTSYQAVAGFVTSNTYAAGQPALSGALGKFTASGHLDAAVSTSDMQAQLLTGQGDGSFIYYGSPGAPTPTSTAAGTPGLWSTVQTGDFNGDGKLDLALTADGHLNLIPQNGSNGVRFQKGNGDGTFTAPRQPDVNTSACPQSSSAPRSLLYGNSVAADFAGTGVQKLANRDNGEVRLSSLPANPSFLDVIEQDTSCTQTHNLIATGKLSGGSLPDLLVQRNGSLLLYPNDGTGNFAPRPLGDLSVDGSLTTPGQLLAPDIATFPGLSKALGFRAFPGSATIADLDGDGNGDLLVVYANLDANRAAPVASAPNYLYIWFGSGGGKFLVSNQHPVNPVRIQLSRNFYQVAVADVSNDGLPDVILSDGYLLSFMVGLGDGTFQPEVHVLAGQGINSILTGDIYGDGKVDLLAVDGGAVLSNPVANLEVLAANPDVNTGGVTVVSFSRANGAGTAGVLVASPNPVAFEAAYSLTATITDSVGITPGGRVRFLHSGAIIGTVTLVNGVATLQASATGGTGGKPLLPGTYTFQGEYDSRAATEQLGTAIFASTLTVLRAPTTVTLTPTTPLQTVYGGPVDGTFAVTVLDPAYPATGTYTVYDNGVAVPICTHLPLTLNGNPVNCPYGNPVLLDAGPHTLQVGYDGDLINAPSLSVGIPYIVAPDPTTITGLTSSLPIAPLGQPVTFSATVTGVLAVPTGTVTFFVSSLIHPLIAVLGTGTLNSAGVATFTISTLPVGTYAITAGYSGNQDFNPSGAGPITQIVITVPTVVASSVSLTSSVNPSIPGQAVTLTATVSVATLHPPVAPGTITFLDGQTVLATQTLNSVGVASFTTSTLASGSHALTAAYGGASGVPPVVAPTPPRPPGNPLATAGLTLTISPSVSPVLTQIVNVLLQPEPVGFTITVTPAPVTLGVGRTAVLLVQVTPVSGFAQPVALSCGSLPFEATCSFAQPTIPAGGGATTLNLATEAPHDCGNPDSPYFLGAADASSPVVKTFAAMFLPGLLLLGVLRRRRVRLLLRDSAVLALACLGMASISGCGHCTDLGTRPGTYTITITGSAQGGPVNQTQAQPLQLTTHY